MSAMSTTNSAASAPSILTAHPRPTSLDGLPAHIRLSDPMSTSPPHHTIQFPHPAHPHTPEHPSGLSRSHSDAGDTDTDAHLLHPFPSTSLAKLHARRLRISSASASVHSVDTAASLSTEYHGPVIPRADDPAHKCRTLVLCFDGTGDAFDLDNSNVVQFFSVLTKGDRRRQLCYYQVRTFLSYHVNSFR